MTYAPGVPCWASLATPDVDVARTFYSGVLDWQIAPIYAATGAHATAMVDGGSVAGIGPLRGAPVSSWTLYFASDDADATAAAITAAGGTVMLAPGDVGDAGRMLIAADPTGAVFAVWQAKGRAGFAAPGTTGSFVWCDLRTPDPDRARMFYASVFGYSFAPVPMAGPEYTTCAPAASPAPIGGIGPMMGAPEGTPPHWLVYFGVADADAAAAAASRLDGQSLAAPFDTPFGRMAPLMDPFGVVFWGVQLSG